MRRIRLHKFFSVTPFKSRLSYCWISWETQCFFLSSNRATLLCTELVSMTKDFMQHANHEAFKKLTRWPYDQAVKEGVHDRLLYIIALDALRGSCSLLWEKPFADHEGVTNHSSGEWCFVVFEAPHPGSTRPQKATPSFVTNFIFCNAPRTLCRFRLLKANEVCKIDVEPRRTWTMVPGVKLLKVITKLLSKIPLFGLISLFNGISTFMGCLMPKQSL